MEEQVAIFIQIVLIDLVLAGDNAIIIGMVASQFPTEQRKKIIFWGIGGINFSNYKLVIEAGANILVSGTTIFKENDGNLKKNIEKLRTV